MAEMLWDQRERQLLQALAEIEERGEPRPDSGRLRDITGLDDLEAQRGLQALEQGGHIIGIPAATNEEHWLIDIRLSGPGLKATGLWPADDAYAALLAGLEARAEAEPEGPTKRRLKEAAVAVAALGKDLGVEVVGAVLSRAIGLA